MNDAFFLSRQFAASFFSVSVQFLTHTVDFFFSLKDGFFFFGVAFFACFVNNTPCFFLCRTDLCFGSAFSCSISAKCANNHCNNRCYDCNSNNIHPLNQFVILIAQRTIKNFALRLNCKNYSSSCNLKFKTE